MQIVYQTQTPGVSENYKFHISHGGFFSSVVQINIIIKVKLGRVVQINIIIKVKLGRVVQINIIVVHYI